MNVLERGALRKIIELTDHAWETGNTSTDIAIELGKRVMGIRILAQEALALEPKVAMAVDAHDDVPPFDKDVEFASTEDMVRLLGPHYERR